MSERPGLQVQICISIPTILLALLFSLPGSSQERESRASDDPWAGVEEMVVTSTGLIDSLTSGTVSVTAFDSTDLEAMGASDVSDVAAYTPNLEIRTAGSTTATLFIRGVGLNDFTSNAAGSVAVYEDDVPKNLPAIQLGQLYDVEAVTVLKGPQGSGAGRNASAGAIKIYTRKPQGEFGGFVRIDYGNYNLVNAEGALEVPILADVLSTRAAFSLERRDGLVSNRCGGLTQEDLDTSVGLCRNAFEQDLRPGIESDLNNLDVWAGRLTTRFDPPDLDMSWIFSFHGSRRDQLGTVGEHIGAINVIGSADRFGYVQPEISRERDQILSSLPSRRDCNSVVDPGPPPIRLFQQLGFSSARACLTNSQQVTGQRLANSLSSRPLDTEPFEGAYNRPGYERQTSWGAYLRGEWQLDHFRIQSITGFERDDRERLIDADYSPNLAFEFDIEDDLWQFSEDLQVSGELEATPLSWTTGVFFLQERLDYYQYTFARLPLQPSSVDYIQDTSSLGVFAEFAWDFMDDFTLEAGARYNWESKTFDAKILSSPGEPGEGNRCNILPNGLVPPCKRTVTVDHPTGTVGINYAYDEMRTFYMKYSHGWKGAQFNSRDGSKQGSVTDVADPEVIDAFELGFDGSWLDGRLSLNGAFFWYVYQNYQVFTFTNNAGEPPQRVVVNADNAALYGAEFEARIEPIDTLVAEIRFGWLDSRFLDFTDSVVRKVDRGDGGQVGVNQRILTDYNGNSLPNAPRFKVSGNISYDFELSFGTITPRYEFTWSDDVYFDPSEGRGSPDVNGEPFMPENTIGQEALILHNFRLGYTVPSGNLEIAGWVRNLTDEVYKTLAFDASAGPGLVGNLVGDPRTYGLSAKVSF